MFVSHLGVFADNSFPPRPGSIPAEEKDRGLLSTEGHAGGFASDPGLRHCGGRLGSPFFFGEGGGLGASRTGWCKESRPHASLRGVEIRAERTAPRGAPEGGLALDVHFRHPSGGRERDAGSESD